jgi:hypothetical protein
MAITWIPVRVNEDLRPSRLVKSIPSYIKRSIITIFRIFIVYEPFRFFIRIGLFLFLIGFAIGIRFLYYFIVDAGQGHIQSLILASILMVMGFQSVLSAFIVDLMAVNRTLLEDIQYRLRKDSAKNTKQK